MLHTIYLFVILVLSLSLVSSVLSLYVHSFARSCQVNSTLLSQSKCNSPKPIIYAKIALKVLQRRPRFISHTPSGQSCLLSIHSQFTIQFAAFCVLFCCIIIIIITSFFLRCTRNTNDVLIMINRNS